MRNKKLYNYIVNTLGISKEIVMEYVDNRLESLISKNVVSKLDSKSVEKMILDQTTYIMDNGILNRPFFTTNSFQNLVIKSIDKCVREHVKDNYKFEMRLIDKDSSVVLRVPKKRNKK